MTRPSDQSTQLLSLFYHWEKETPEALFLRQPYSGVWKELTYAQAGQEARRMATALQQIAPEPGSHIGLFSKNCYHWILADLAIMMAGHISVPFFPNLNRDQLSEVLAKGDVQILFAGKLDEWEAVKEAVPSHVRVITFPHYPGNAKIEEGESWDELVAAHPPLTGHPLADLDQLWSILFTSGTTGTPKGVMLTHRCCHTLWLNEERHNDLGLFGQEPQRHFSYLPLNHIAERITSEFGSLMNGSSIAFAESLETFPSDLKAARPTTFFGVPRIYAKFQAAIFEKLPPEKLDRLLRIPLLSGFIRKKIKKGMGLDQSRSFYSAAAPLPDSLKLWYRRLGINIRDVYGMTENCGPVTVMPENSQRLDSVGKAMGDAKVKILPETGEICLYAPWNMIGYYKDPSLTAEVLHDGWVHTGDKGILDEQGFLRIIGRVKDTFKSAKGKFIIPAPLENGFAENEYIEQACVVGRGLPQPILLCSLSPLGREADPRSVETRILADLEKTNTGLQNYEKLGVAVILKDNWNVENGILTPTMKVRRNIVDEKYHDHYEKWLTAGKRVVWEAKPASL